MRRWECERHLIRTAYGWHPGCSEKPKKKYERAMEFAGERTKPHS
jgi:hypothetical protein